MTTQELLYALGLLALLVGMVLLTVTGFRRSVGWGLAVLFVPFAVFVLVAKEWRSAAAKIGLVSWLGGWLLLFLGYAAARGS